MRWRVIPRWILHLLHAFHLLHALFQHLALLFQAMLKTVKSSMHFVSTRCLTTGWRRFRWPAFFGPFCFPRGGCRLRLASTLSLLQHRGLICVVRVFDVRSCRFAKSHLSLSNEAHSVVDANARQADRQFGKRNGDASQLPSPLGALDGTGLRWCRICSAWNSGHRLPWNC